jgi:hypothetical protein
MFVIDISRISFGGLYARHLQLACFRWPVTFDYMGGIVKHFCDADFDEYQYLIDQQLVHVSVILPVSPVATLGGV